MKRTSLQKGANAAVRMTVEGASLLDDKEKCAFIVDVNYEEGSWKARVSYHQLAFLPHCLHEPKFKVPIPIYKNDKKLVSDVNSWLNELADHCFHSTANTAALLSILNYRQDKKLSDSLSLENVCHRLNRGHVFKTGYLLKLSGSSKNNNSNNGNNNNNGVGGGRDIIAKRKFVVLCEDLRYFDHESAFECRQQPKGVFSLDSFFVSKVIDPTDDSGSSNSNNSNHTGCDITLVNCDGVSMTWRAASTEELDSWYFVLSNLPNSV